ncbi:hypothetical protein IRT45_35255 [Nocardia sp. BSTN01]|uniref:hypothetical protein n=1 Tax=Nocardia sp. BSTN01 TaxID=2783665 RepID=UPI00188FBB99|nr:hypothetical protein [Nocardia sp. BSTN01]MBF5002377.1 hypothetical protein [Nocardia sp. BSTN01]
MPIPNSRTVMGMHTAVDLVEALHLNATATDLEDRLHHARRAQNIIDQCDPGPTLFTFATLVLMLTEAYGENLPGFLDGLRGGIPAFDPGAIDAAADDTGEADQPVNPYAHLLPAPPQPDLGPPSVMSSVSGHVLVLLYPWADDDHDTVVSYLDAMVNELRAIVEETRRSQGSDS